MTGFVVTIDLLNYIIVGYISKYCVLQGLLEIFVAPVEINDVTFLQQDFPPGFLVRS
jgi:hypothetical protein